MFQSLGSTPSEKFPWLARARGGKGPKKCGPHDFLDGTMMHRNTTRDLKIVSNFCYLKS